MRALSTAELLTVWELGTAQSAAQRALILLAAAEAESPAQLTLGQRDACLLELRESVFGSRLTSLANCPACREGLEFEIETRDLHQSAPSEIPQAINLTSGDFAVHFRLPTSRDLAALDPGAEVETNRQNLLGRCLLQAQRAGQEISVVELDDEVVRQISERMAAADPQAEIELALVCPACGERWRSAFEIVSFFWSELHAWAVRLLQDVHLLASAYGWRESEIFALPPARRQIYLEMLQA